MRMDTDVPVWKFLQLSFDLKISQISKLLKVKIRVYLMMTLCSRWSVLRKSFSTLIHHLESIRECQKVKMTYPMTISSSQIKHEHSHAIMSTWCLHDDGDLMWKCSLETITCLYTGVVKCFQHFWLTAGNDMVNRAQ